MAGKMKRQYLPQTRGEALKEARTYFQNAKETLKKCHIEFGIYKEPKFVKESAAMGYLAALKAIDGYLLGKGLAPERLPCSIQEYTKALKKIPQNGKLMAAFTVVYQNLHIFAYYRGGIGVEMIKEGFANTKKLIDTFSKYDKGGV